MPASDNRKWISLFMSESSEATVISWWADKVSGNTRQRWAISMPTGCNVLTKFLSGKYPPQVPNIRSTGLKGFYCNEQCNTQPLRYKLITSIPAVVLPLSEEFSVCKVHLISHQSQPKQNLLFLEYKNHWHQLEQHLLPMVIASPSGLLTVPGTSINTSSWNEHWGKFL